MKALGLIRAWSWGRRVLVAAGLLLVVAAAAWWQFGESFYLRWALESPTSGSCNKRLDRAVLERSIQLGTAFLLAHQKPAGNFDYQYDWRSQRVADDDQDTRQAGAVWALTLLYAERPTPQLAAAIRRGLDFFNQNSVEAEGARCTAYPGAAGGAEIGRVGTVALVALAHIDFLRSAADLSDEQRAHYGQMLDQYAALLTRSVQKSGLWYGEYKVAGCKARGEASPYTDGEALLALVKAARYLGRRDLLPVIMRTANAGRRLNIDKARTLDADSDTTKGYYQWSSMAFYELATSDFPDTAGYGDALLQLADWMIDEHGVLTRSRNTAYAFEGIIHAYALAKQRRDTAREAKFGCVIDLGLEHMLSWQVGSPRPNRYTESAKVDDAKALGGVQNSAFDPNLRIDVTQHQMHATQLARRYVY